VDRSSPLCFLLSMRWSVPKAIRSPLVAMSLATRQSSTISRRIQQTDTPCIVTMQQMMRGRADVLSLAQGIVHWSPPAEALQAASHLVTETASSLYGADDGLPELRTALKSKLARENGLVASEVMVTAGANQGYTNLVLSLLDAGDAAVLFAPYYFNHLMALQMTGSATEVHIGASTPELLPDLKALRAEMGARQSDGRAPIRMVTISNPGNPTGAMMPHDVLLEASELCAEYGAWLVMVRPCSPTRTPLHAHWRASSRATPPPASSSRATSHGPPLFGRVFCRADLCFGVFPRTTRMSTLRTQGRSLTGASRART
jgi:DNA-binding transcriptional MocR family regulator